MDTRNKKDDYVTKYFDKQGIKWIRNKLYAGDVKLLNDTKIIIDLKANLEEIAHNLCNSREHSRIHRELDRAREIGCEQFIFLIKEDDGALSARSFIVDLPPISFNFLVLSNRFDTVTMSTSTPKLYKSNNSFSVKVDKLSILNP